MALVDKKIFLQYDVPGPVLWHERHILEHYVDEQYVVVTPDRDIYIEDCSMGNSDLRGIRHRSVGGGLPVGLRASHVYTLPPFTAAEMAGFKAEAGRQIAAQAAADGGGAGLGNLARAGAVGAPAPLPGGASNTVTFEPDVLYWLAAEALPGGHQLRSLFVICCRGRDRGDFLSAPGGWDIRTGRVFLDSLGKPDLPLKDAAARSVQSPVSWNMSGPRAARWCIAYLVNEGMGLEGHHERFRTLCKVDGSAWGAQEHFQLTMMVRHALQIDQLNGYNLMSVEVMFRRMQTIEHMPRRPVKNVRPRGRRGVAEMMHDTETGGGSGAAAARFHSPLHDDPRVPRDIFPLPEVGCQDPPDRSLSRGCLQRWQRRQKQIDDVNVRGDPGPYNSMYDPTLKSTVGPIHSLPSSRVSAAQAEALLRIQNAVRRLGPPPADVTVPEALRQLRCEGYVDESQATGALTSFCLEKVSLPSGGWSPIPLCDLGGSIEGTSVDVYVQQQLLPAEMVQQRLEATGVVHPYSDPKLRDPKTYGKFLDRLCKSNLVEFVDGPGVEEIAVFFVSKKNGMLRMIIDARRSNCHFRDPDYVQLCTGEALGKLELDPGGGLMLPPVDASVDTRRLEARLFALAASTILDLLLLGWVTIFVFVIGAPARSQISCIQNMSIIFLYLGRTERTVHRLKQAGLQVHEEKVCDEKACVLGWEFENSGFFGPTARRVWKTRLAIRALLRRRRASGKQLEILIGLCSFISLARRECLGIFAEVYKFMRQHAGNDIEHGLPRGVKRELWMWDSVCPLIFQDLRAQWSETIHAVDASLWGMGVTTASLDYEGVKRVGRYNERWRFKDEDARVARRLALKLDGLQDSFGPDGDVTDAAWHRRKSSSFEPVPFSVVDREWSTVVSHRWRSPLTLPVGEARSALTAVKHILRTTSNFGLRHLILTDSLTSCGALSRGRSSRGTWKPSRPKPLEASRSHDTSGHHPGSAVSGKVRTYCEGEAAGPRTAREQMQREHNNTTILEQASVSKACRLRYQGLWDELSPKLCKANGLLKPMAEVESILCDHLEALFLDGADLATAQYTVAAVLYFNPGLRTSTTSSMPRVKQSLTGWRKLAPAKSQLPLPFEVVALMAAWAFGLGQIEIGLFLLLAFSLYLRPSEGLRIRAQDMIRPTRGRGPFSRWGFVLHPFECQIPSKTQEYDETLMLDLACHQQLGAALWRCLKVQTMPPNQNIFSVTAGALNQFMEEASQALNLQALGYLHLYRLRHGGVSHDFSHNLRSLQEVQLCGRWRSLTVCGGTKKVDAWLSCSTSFPPMCVQKL
ncbi:unnamed protein product [Symbiodinium sp. CCMP2592]|nr:unnamed protein product [Symbiodinium sp. CCMP2592]